MIAQDLFALFVEGTLAGRGFLLKELCSGIGFVDFSIILSRVIHLVEIKILSGQFTGVGQLDQYMRNESRREGWLVVFETRPTGARSPIPAGIPVASGLVRTLVVDVNPTSPSRVHRTLG
jgi:hypothetical protein